MQASTIECITSANDAWYDFSTPGCRLNGFTESTIFLFSSFLPFCVVKLRVMKFNTRFAIKEASTLVA